MSPTGTPFTRPWRGGREVLVVDTNVLIYGADRGFTEHRRCRDLLESLRSVHRLQSALARSCRSLVARTFGVSSDSLREEDRRAEGYEPLEREKVRWVRV